MDLQVLLKMPHINIIWGRDQSWSFTPKKMRFTAAASDCISQTYLSDAIDASWLREKVTQYRPDFFGRGVSRHPQQQ
jgi:hypothetical protein